jgi:hypothetical protein
MITQIIAETSMAVGLDKNIDYGIAYAVMGAVILALWKLCDIQRKEMAALNKSYSDDYIKLLVQTIEVTNKNSFMIESAPINVKHQIKEELESFKKEIAELIKQQTPN